MARQYNLKNFNGVYLKSPYDYNSYNINGVNALIKNFDFYPLKSTDVTDFSFINSSVNLVPTSSIYYDKIMGDSFIGSNSYSNRTHDLAYSEIKKINELVKGEKYYTKFDFYFNFDGLDADGFEVNTSGYTINVNLYAVLGNTKRKLKLSDLKVYNYTGSTYSNTTANPVDAGYVTPTSSYYKLYYNAVNITGDTINMSFYPKPRIYDLINNSYDIITGSGYPISFSHIEGDSSSINYGSSISVNTLAQSVGRVTSFSTPVVSSPGVLPSAYKIVDNGYDQTEISPFNVMNGGPLFKVTAQLDAATQSQFDANICKGNKDFKLMVDYNGTMSKTIITYVPISVEISGPVDGFVLP